MAETPTTPEGTTPTPPPPAPESPEFRYADDATVPIELRGRTAAEAAEIFTLYTSGAGPVVPPSPPAPTPPLAPPPTNGAYASVGDLQRVAQQSAQVTLSLARQQHGDAFNRWGGEIGEVLQRVPVEQWNLDVIESAVRMVKGNHLEEIVAERVRTATMQSGGGMRSGPLVGAMRSGGNGGSGYAPQTPEPPIERVPEQWLQHAAQAGISDQEVAEFERANDMLPGEFFKQFGGRFVTDAVADVNFRRKA